MWDGVVFSTEGFLSDFLILLGWTIGAVILGKVFQFLFSRMGRIGRFKEKELFAVVFKAFGQPMPFLFGTLGFYIGFGILELSGPLAALQKDVFRILFTIASSYFCYSFVHVIDHSLTRIAKRTSTKIDDMMAPIICKSLRAVIVVAALVHIGQILSGKPLTTIITGLGIGGLAVALAAQETIKNFFGSIVIFADQPFELGERIKVCGHDGIIEEVGFRSTRIRTLDGHLVTVPNGELANLTIQNISKRPYIRRIMNVTITYNTPLEKVEEALSILKEILKDHEGMAKEFPPRVYFNDYNAASLNILAIYWYHPPEYWAFLQHAERINMELFRRYNEAGIEFAFPTQTLYLAGDPLRELKFSVETSS